MNNINNQMDGLNCHYRRLMPLDDFKTTFFFDF